MAISDVKEYVHLTEEEVDIIETALFGQTPTTVVYD